MKTKVLKYVGSMGAVTLPTWGELKRGDEATLPCELADAYLAQSPSEWEEVKKKKSFRDDIIEKES